MLANSPATVYLGYIPMTERIKKTKNPNNPVFTGFTIVIDFERERVWSYILRSAKIKPDLKKVFPEPPMAALRQPPNLEWCVGPTSTL